MPETPATNCRYNDLSCPLVIAGPCGYRPVDGPPAFGAPGSRVLIILTAVTTIEQLERDVWPDPGPEATSLVRRCTELRRKPLAEFTVEDPRLMLGRQWGSGVGCCG